MSDRITSLTAEVERLAGLLRDANAEIARLRGEVPTEPDRSGWPVLVADRGGRYRWPDGNPAVMLSREREGTFRAVVDGSCGDVFYATAQAAADAIEARLPEEVAPMVTPPKVGDRWGDLTPEQRAMVPVGSELGDPLDAPQGAYPKRVKMAAVDGRSWGREGGFPVDDDEGIIPDRRLTRIGPAPEPPPTTDPPKLLIGMVYEWSRDAALVTGGDWAVPADTTAIYDTIADYRAGRALWRR